RQHASRARRALADAHPPPRAHAEEQRRLVGAFADALGRGDVEALVSLLHPDVVLVNDSGGMTRAARREGRGADKVARLFLGLLHGYGPETMFKGWAPVLVNGEQGHLAGGHGGLPESVNVFSISDGRIRAIYGVLNPAKLAGALLHTRPRRDPHRSNQ